MRWVALKNTNESIKTNKNEKSCLCHTRGVAPRRVKSGGAHLRAPGQHRSEETMQRQRASMGNTVTDLAG